MAFMDRFRFGGQNDLLQMPNQNKQFGMFQNPFPQQNQQQQGFGMFRNPMQQQPGLFPGEYTNSQEWTPPMQNPQQGGNVRQQQSIGNPNMAPFNGQPTEQKQVGYQKPGYNPEWIQPRTGPSNMFGKLLGGFGPPPPASMQPTMEDYTMSDGTVRKSQAPTMFNGRRYMRDGVSGQWHDMDSGMAHAT